MYLDLWLNKYPKSIMHFWSDSDQTMLWSTQVTAWKCIVCRTMQTLHMLPYMQQCLYRDTYRDQYVECLVWGLECRYVWTNIERDLWWVEMWSSIYIYNYNYIYMEAYTYNCNQLTWAAGPALMLGRLSKCLGLPIRGKMAYGICF